MYGLKGENLDDVQRYLIATLADPTGTINAPLTQLLAFVPKPVIDNEVRKVLNRDPPLALAAKRVVTGFGTAGLSSLFTAWGEDAQYIHRERKIFAIFNTGSAERSILDLDDKDKSVFLNHFQLYRDDPDTKRAIARWQRFLALFAVKGGASQIIVPGKNRSSHELPTAIAVLSSFFPHYLPAYEAFLASAAQDVELFYRNAAASPARSLPTLPQHTPASGQSAPRPPLFTNGAHWLTATELHNSKLFTTTPSPSALIIGVHKETQETVYYPHNESLVTIAPTGTSKTQGHVIPNLLTYPGSAFVLDVKGELWNTTAGYRAKHFGPVYRFAPTDPTGRTHCYNPFDFIPADATQAAHGCQLLAHQLVPPGDKRNDYWLGRARDFIYAFAMLVVFKHPRSERNLPTLANYLALPTSFKKGASDPLYLTSETATVIASLRDLAKSIQIPDLAHNATAFENALSDPERLESIFDTARQHLSMFSRSAVLRQAMASSTWSPKDLRFRTGTTVYVCLNPGDLKPFAPIIRILFQQHAELLTRNFKPKPGVPPITFFLDEVPQLGYLASLNDLLDLGRGAGIRLWLFAQYFGQFSRTYDKLAQGLIGNCRVTCWMQPDTEAAKILIPNLGAANNLFSGKTTPLVQDFQLAGRDYAEDTFVIARGEHPMRLDKREAFRFYADRMHIEPPAISSLHSPPKPP